VSGLVFLGVEGGPEPLPLTQEYASIHRALGPHLAVTRLEDWTPSRLHALLGDRRPTIVHWMGHGLPNRSILVPDGTPQPVGMKPEPLARVLGPAIAGAQLVVLSACYSSQLARLLRSYVPCVVGWDVAVADETARAFAEALYGALGQGASLGEAFAEAQSAVIGLDSAMQGHFALEHRPEVHPIELVLVGPDSQPAPAAVAQAPELEPVRALFVLNAFALPFPLEEARRRVPTGATPLVEVSYEGRGGPVVGDQGADRTLIDWGAMARAIRGMVDELRSRLRDVLVPVHLYVTGNAPLPAYALAGHLCSAWMQRLTFLHVDNRSKVWSEFALPGPDAGAPYFDLQVSLAGGTQVGKSSRKAIFIDALGNSTDASGVPTGMVDQLLSSLGEQGTLGSLIHTRKQRVSPENFGSIWQELSATMSGLSVSSPGLQGVALFLAAPTPVAWLAGAAINPNQFPSVWLTERGPDGAKQVRYHLAFALPFAEARAVVVPMDPASVLARQPSRQALFDGMAELLGRSLPGPRGVAPAELVPPGTLGLGAEAADVLGRRLRQRLDGMVLDPTPATEGLALDPLSRRLRLGESLLAALPARDPEALGRAGQLLLVHEILHQGGALEGASLRASGRDGLALAPVDLLADALALRAVVGWRLALGGEAAAAGCAELLGGYLDAHLDLLVTWDRSEQGARLLELREARLQRYLHWAIQRLRAEAMHAPDLLGRLLGALLTVCVAPLRGRVNAEGEALVVAPQPDAELRLNVEGRLLREPLRTHGVDPDTLLEAVRSLDPPRLVELLRPIVRNNLALVAPWT